MWVVHTRLAEIWQKAKRTNKDNPLAGLSDEEVKDFIHCLDANLNCCWKVSRLQNMSQIAHETGNTEWLLEISAEIEKINMDLVV